MGANRRNKLGIQSRRFSICRILKDDTYYLSLLDAYLESKLTCQDGKIGHDLHIANLEKLSQYVNELQKNFNHSGVRW